MESGQNLLAQSSNDTTAQTTDNVEMTDKIRELQYIYKQYFDVQYTRMIAEQCMKPIVENWFRAQLVGFDTMPKRNNPNRPLIYACNHSGMSFPWDAMVMGYLINTKFDFSPDTIRALASPMLSMSLLMNPFQVPDLWKKIGAVDATFDNFEAMMFYNKQNLLIYPEGVPGIGKGFHRKYQLQAVRTSMIRMSVKYRTDIIPIASINAEYSNPYAYSLGWVDKLFNLIGIPYLPLGPVTPLLLLQPWTFYIAFPAKMTFVMGKRISPYEWTNKPYNDITQEEFNDMATRVHDLMQAEITDGVKKYGQKPYRWGELFKALGRNWRMIPYILPTGWPMMFTEFDKQYQKKKENTKINLGFLSTFRILIKYPLLIAFFIPILGWIPLLINGYRNAKIKKIRF